MVERTSTLRTVTGPVRVVGPHSPVSALVQRAPVAVDEQSTIADAVEAMRAAHVSSLLLADSIGIVTERDIARALGAGRSPEDPVEAIASRHPLGVTGDMTVVAAAELMLNEEVRHLVVALDGNDIGVVSIRDVLAVLVQAADPSVWLTSLRISIDPPTEIWLG
jgi:CBS domain-containing protein